MHPTKMSCQMGGGTWQLNQFPQNITAMQRFLNVRWSKNVMFPIGDVEKIAFD